MNSLIFETVLQIRIASSANLAEHHFVKRKREKPQLFKILLALKPQTITLPCCIVLTRIAPRELDDDDNLRYAFKSHKDKIADILIPGLAPGRADGDKRLQWKYAQEKGKPKEYAMKIQIYDGHFL